MRLFWVGMLCAVAGLSACSSGSSTGGTGGGAGGGSGNCSGAAKTPPNLVPNNGFECGDMGWSPQSGTLSADTDARTGTQSAKLVATAAGGKFAVTLPVVTSASGKTYCAVAYLKGTVADAQLSVLEDKGGSVIDHTFSTPVASTTWLRTPPSTTLGVPAAVGSKLYVRLLMRTPNANDTLLVDDVDLWESSDGQCKETR
jgi:hypothetical protein